MIKNKKKNLKHKKSPKKISNKITIIIKNQVTIMKKINLKKMNWWMRLITTTMI